MTNRETPLLPLRVANCSGFYGDRMSAAQEMVEGGPIDFLTGDWLAELTMLILAKDRMKDPRGGYGRTFVAQMEQVMGTCLDRGIRVVTNAGGLNPAGCAAAVKAVADRLGLSPVIAYVEGDDLLDRLSLLQAAGEELRHLGTGEPFGDRKAITANAYLGCWGIVSALAAGADIVITGRTTDASLTMGPAAWYFGWDHRDWDRLAGACVAGHILECGTQATGGNYSFFQEVPGLERPGFPLAEISLDGSSVITKHPGTGGLVSVGTVTAQLLYEINGVSYFNPDVVARFDTVHLEQQRPDRVRVSGVRGEPAPSDVKVCINYEGGYRSSMSFLLTGLNVEAKAELIQRTIWQLVPGGRTAFSSVTTRLIRSEHSDPPSNEEAIAELTITVKDPDPIKVRRLRTVAIEMGLATYPGMFVRDPLADARPYGVHWPALLPASTCCSEVVVGDKRIPVPSRPSDPGGATAVEEPVCAAMAVPSTAQVPEEPTVRAPLGRIMGARSGDKGGDATVGVWTNTPEAYAWLSSFLTVDKLTELFPEARSHPVTRDDLPNLLALSFVFHGLLEEGVAASSRLDPQAKGFGEYLRARHVDLPVRLLK